ncbi:MAG TPA: choice-of-anchor D domain-containing protein [Candidatus Angelobacter sp.]|nr:choice-of-anchor D domain-containing protein [Candidatus Angelobacter sp.]
MRFLLSRLVIALCLVCDLSGLAQTPASSHVFLIVLENTSYGTITNSSDSTNYMPNLVALGNKYGHATNYKTNSAGSLMAYLWLSSGYCHSNPASTADCPHLPAPGIPSQIPPGVCTAPCASSSTGIHSFNCTGGSCLTADGSNYFPITDTNIYREMINHAPNPISWKAYAESLPYAGYTGPRTSPPDPYSAYDPHHNGPLWYIDSGRGAPLAQQLNMVPFTQFVTDLANNQLPQYSIIIPNDDHDAHDGTPQAADDWLQSNVFGPLLSQPFFQPGGDGLLILTFDNGDFDGEDFVYTAVIGPAVKPGYVSDTFYQHQDTLLTILQALGITERPGYTAIATGFGEFFLPMTASAVLSTTSLVFGSQTVGVSATNTVTLTNNGAATLNINSIAVTAGATDFSRVASASNDCGNTLAANASCVVTISFKPSTSGPRSGTLTLTTSAANSPQTVALSGAGVATAPIAGLSRSSIDFGTQAQNTAATATVILSNTGNATLNSISISVTLDPADFTRVTSAGNDCGASLNAGASCVITVRFQPTVLGQLSGMLTVADSAGNSPQTVTLTGKSVRPATPVFMPAIALDFSSQPLNVPVTRPVTLTNTGDVALSLASMMTSGDYTQTNNCGNTVDVGITCTINVTLTATATGTRNGTLIVTDSAPGSPQSINLTGTGVLVPLGLLPASLNFSPQLVGTVSAVQPVMVTNSRSSVVTVAAVAVSAGYLQNNNCATLAGGASCTVNVSFAPASIGAQNGLLTVQFGGTQSTLPLSGSGMDFFLAPQSGATTSATVSAGQTAIYNLSVSGAAGFTGMVTLACGGAPANATCTSNPQSVSVSGGAAANFNLSIGTAARGGMAPGFRLPQLPPPAAWMTVLPALLAVLATFMASRRQVRYAGLAFGMVLVFAALTGCGGGSATSTSSNSSKGTPAGTSTITVTATAGAASRTFNLTLTVN